MIEFPSWQARKAKRPYSATITPLMDIMFLLLLFFILTASVSLPVIPVKLAQTESGELVTDRTITISVMQTGEILFEGKIISSSDLAARMREQIADDDGVQVVIAADKNAPFGSAADVMDIIRTTGVKNISLLVENRE